MYADGAPTAEGDLGRTPTAHLLVYAVERRLTGSLVLLEPCGVEHVVRLVSGAPAKIRAGDGYARLGEILIEEGAISQETLERALETQGVLLGDVLLLSGCLDGATLEWLAEVQVVRRAVRLFSLPPETTFRYFDGFDALEGWGGDPACLDPLAVLWAGLREHGERPERLEHALERVGDGPLQIHPALSPGRFGFREAELAAITWIRERAPTRAELAASGVAPADTIDKLVYALAITRYLDLGAGGVPVGAEDPAAAQAIGRMQLRPTFYRAGAAAPDPAGDGERASTSPRRRRARVTPPPEDALDAAAPAAGAAPAAEGAAPAGPEDAAADPGAYRASQPTLPSALDPPPRERFASGLEQTGAHEGAGADEVPSSAQRRVAGAADGAGEGSGDGEAPAGAAEG